jgi:hypothetical protein
MHNLTDRELEYIKTLIKLDIATRVPNRTVNRMDVLRKLKGVRWIK